jgi:hypothetical protein
MRLPREAAFALRRVSLGGCFCLFAFSSCSCSSRCAARLWRRALRRAPGWSASCEARSAIDAPPPRRVSSGLTRGRAPTTDIVRGTCLSPPTEARVLDWTSRIFSAVRDATQFTCRVGAPEGAQSRRLHRQQDSGRVLQNRIAGCSTAPWLGADTRSTRTQATRELTAVCTPHASRKRLFLPG